MIALLAPLCEALPVPLVVGVSPEVTVTPSLKVPLEVALGLTPEDLEGTGSLVTLDDREEVEEAVGDPVLPLDLLESRVKRALKEGKVVGVAVVEGSTGVPLTIGVVEAVLDGEGRGRRLRVVEEDPVPLAPPASPNTPLPVGMADKLGNPTVEVGVPASLRDTQKEEEALLLAMALARELGLGRLDWEAMGVALVLEEPDADPLLKVPTGVPLGIPTEALIEGELDSVPKELWDGEAVMELPTPKEADPMAVLVTLEDPEGPEDSEAQALGVAIPLPVPPLTVTVEEALGKEEALAEAEGAADRVAAARVCEFNPLVDPEELTLASIEAVKVPPLDELGTPVPVGALLTVAPTEALLVAMEEGVRAPLAAGLSLATALPLAGREGDPKGVRVPLSVPTPPSDAVPPTVGDPNGLPVGDTPVGMGEGVTPLGVGLTPPLPLPRDDCVGVKAGDTLLSTLPLPLSEEDPQKDTGEEGEGVCKVEAVKVCVGGTEGVLVPLSSNPVPVGEGVEVRVLAAAAPRLLLPASDAVNRRGV